MSNLIMSVLLVCMEIYSMSFAVLELKTGNRKGFMAIMIMAIISMFLFLQYLM